MTRRLFIGVLLAIHPAVAVAQGTNCEEFRIDSFGGGIITTPAVASAASGAFVAVWNGHDTVIRGRRYDASGTPLGAEFPISFPGANPAIAMDPAGNFVVVWYTATGILGQRFDASGGLRGPQFMVTPSPGTPAVAVNPAGEFVVTWRNGVVRARRYDATGMPVGPEFTVDPSTTVFEASPSVSYLTTGAFVIVWQDVETAGQPVVGRRFDTNGLPMGTPFQVSDSAAEPAHPHVAAGPGGDFLVVWPHFAPHRRLAGRVFDAAGTPRGPEFHVSQVVNAHEEAPSIASDPLHGYVVVWYDSYGIVGQRLDPAARHVGPTFVVTRTGVSGLFRFPKVAWGAGGQYVAVFDGDVSGGATGIFVRLGCPARFHPITPCRAADTRFPAPGAPLSANSGRSFPLAGTCGIPADAAAVVLNATAVSPTDLGTLRLHPGLTAPPLASTLNFAAGRTRANNATVAVGTDGQVAVQCDMPVGSAGLAHLVLDVYGYYR